MIKLHKEQEPEDILKMPKVIRKHSREYWAGVEDSLLRVVAGNYSPNEVDRLLKEAHRHIGK